ncbi:MAG: T9SS type B sorting domain-containing protein [Bacteroidetes bacterium]|nr:T9SS type B sorting domain-containing protein [Bacteroidota bacterium]
MKIMLRPIVFLFAIISSVQAQVTLTLTGPDYNQGNPLNCAGIVPTGGTNFIDGTGNYAPNMNETLVLCPDLNQGSKVSIAFATNIGFEWDVHPTDTLYIYDGPTTAAPLIGAYNNGTNPVGFFAQASWNNPSGCLTLRFKSNGANEGTGWVANVACGNPPQPIVPHVEVFKNGSGPNIMNPLDTGYVDLCPGDSVLLKALPSFPYSLENTNTGYSQTNNNCTFTWTIGGIGQLTGDQIWFAPTSSTGYYVDLAITDQFPQTIHSNFKVRVSVPPIFVGTGPLEDTVCLGQNTYLIGGVTSQDTVGIEIPGGTFQIGGTFAGLTFLPDGAGQMYQTNIPMSGFDSTTVISSGADIEQICLDIEHSYIGDLEITLTCPNGTTVSLMNAYNQTPFGWTQLVPGGCGNFISTFLGNDNNIDGGNPGSPVWTYCFSTTNNTFNTICAENAAGNTVTNDYGYTSMNPNGIYLPDGDFNQFAGCPINGNWTISVQDNQGIDDGYIFSWGIYFNASLYPESEGYQNYVVTEGWVFDPTIISGQNDTLIVIQPSSPGIANYTYGITDNFGCQYDTTVSFVVLPRPAIFSDTAICHYNYFVGNTSAYAGGQWYALDTAVHFMPSNLVDNPQIMTYNMGGIYPVFYVDNACQDTVSSSIEFMPYVYATIFDSAICQGASLWLNPYVINTTPLQQGYNPPIIGQWWDGSTEVPRLATEAGNYIYTAQNACNTISDTAQITYTPCDLVVPNVITVNGDGTNELFQVESSGLIEFNCVIVNRWGNLIYEFNDPLGSWDGKSNGELVTDGIYFYKIIGRFEGVEENIIKHGLIHVIH